MLFLEELRSNKITFGDIPELRPGAIGGSQRATAAVVGEKLRVFLKTVAEPLLDELVKGMKEIRESNSSHLQAKVAMERLIVLPVLDSNLENGCAPKETEASLKQVAESANLLREVLNYGDMKTAQLKSEHVNFRRHLAGLQCERQLRGQVKLSTSEDVLLALTNPESGQLLGTVKAEYPAHCEVVSDLAIVLII